MADISVLLEDAQGYLDFGNTVSRALKEDNFGTAIQVINKAEDFGLDVRPLYFELALYAATRMDRLKEGSHTYTLWQSIKEKYEADMPNYMKKR